MKYFLGFLVCIGLIVGVFILVLRGFSGHGAPKNIKPLSDYANSDTVVQMTIDGPVGSDQQHQAYRITVGRSDATIQTLQGYQASVIDTKVYQNNQDGYDNFLRALDLAGFTKGDAKSTNTNERGYCPTGDRYIFEIVNGASDAQRYWSTSCRNAGTFKGNVAQVKQLFIAQIPPVDFAKETAGLHL